MTEDSGIGPLQEPSPEDKILSAEEYIRQLEARMRTGVGQPESGAEDGEQKARPAPVCCLFNRAGKDYHLPVEYMLEIGESLIITPLPLAPRHVVGLVNLRGDAVPVIDLARLDGEAPPVRRLSERLLIADAGGERLAFVADGMPDLSPETSGERIEVVSFVRDYKVGAPDG